MRARCGLCVQTDTAHNVITALVQPRNPASTLSNHATCTVQAGTGRENWTGQSDQRAGLYEKNCTLFHTFELTFPPTPPTPTSRPVNCKGREIHIVRLIVIDVIAIWLHFMGYQLVKELASAGKCAPEIEIFFETFFRYTWPHFFSSIASCLLF